VDHVVRILLAEGDPAYAAFVADLIDDPACELSTVPTLAAALDSLVRSPADCVLLDLNLPDARGLTGLCRLVADAPDVPVVVVAGLDEDHLALASIAEGAHEYLVKADVSARRLRRTIAQAIQRKRGESELESRARHDPLTGLANRATLADRVAQAIARLARLPGRELALLYIDLDGFKCVNDSLGHAAGDAVLREVARRLASAVRPSDAVARYGGDEFVVLCDAIGSRAVAQSIVQRIEALLGRPMMIGDMNLRIGASVGVAFSQADGDVDALLAEADRAMYVAKRMAIHAAKLNGV
jgi:diguanylate cyclase (GGDEF)-like protein